jgi:hypothetical protein
VIAAGITLPDRVYVAPDAVELKLGESTCNVGMKWADDDTLRDVISQVANALQSAVLITTQLQTKTTERADAVASLERTLRRAASAMRQLQPREGEARRS